MSKVQNPLIGRASGSVGGVTFSTWKGINVLKSKPESVANPRSDAQLAQRSAMSQIVAAFRAMTSAINAGFASLAVKKSAYNAFSSYNLRNAFDLSNPPTAVFKPEELRISQGSMATTPIVSVTSDSMAGTVTLTFSATADGPGQSLTDRAIVAIHNVTNNTFYGIVSSATRADGSVVISDPAGLDDSDNLRVYLGFTSVDSLRQSDSVNVAEIV